MRYNAVLDILKGDEGAYASHVPAWLNFLCSYVDFVWFVALLGWILVLLWWWNISRRTAPPAWGWLPWSAGAGLAMAIIAFVDLTSSRLGSSSRETYIAGDRAMTLVFLVTVAGWWVQAGRQGTGRAVRTSYFAAAVLPLPLLIWFFSLPPSHSLELPMIGWLMLALSVTAVLPWLCMRSANPWSRAAIMLAGWLPLVSTVGPLSRRILFMGERFSTVTPLGCVAAGMQALVAFLALAGIVRATLANRSGDERSRLWLEVRPFLAAGLACISLGLLVAAWIGGRQLESARERVLDHAALAAAQVDPGIIAAMLGPPFRLDKLWAGGRRYYPPTRLAYSKFLAQGGEAAAKQMFLPMARASRTMTHLRFITLRGGWLVGTVGYTAPFMGSLADAFGGTSLNPATPVTRWSTGYVLLARQPSGDDLVAWSRKSEWLEGPVCTPVFSSPVVFARAPVLTREGRMLGWLEFTYMADAFLAGVVQARVAPFVGSILGLMLTALLFVQRRDARRREAALLEAAVAAEASRAKTDFLAKVSHELRTPLQSLLGYGELIGQHVATDAGRTHLAAQRAHGELMLRLVNDLLDLTAIEAGAFRFVLKPVDIAGLVAEVVASLRPAAEAKGLALNCTIRPEVPAWVQADAQRLRQIVINLAGNAVKFAERGDVEVTLSVKAADASGCRLELAVRDNGPGISAADQARLFQPFSRLAATSGQEGAGLGLALTQALCRSAAGSLTVESDGRSGACFRAVLLMQPCRPPEVTAEGEAKSFASLQGLKILVADDNILVRELFVTHLRELGAACETANDGEAALACAGRGEHDVLVLDLSMPRMDGLEVARRLRASGLRTLRIVGVSAHATPAMGTQAREAGMDAFLMKPVQLAELTAAISTQPGALTADRNAIIKARLAGLFRNEVEAQASAVSAALERRDWVELQARVHYLKGSAGVVGDEALYAACGEVEEAAEARSVARADTAWQRCVRELTRWLP